jgi:molybdate transport system permease protein
MNWSALWLSLSITFVAAFFIFIVGLVTAIFLVRVQFWGKTAVETVILLPLVLPPSVVGYFLIVALGAGSPFVEWFNFNLLFTWQGATVAAAVVGLPLMVQAAKSGIAGVDPTIEEAAQTLGAAPLRVLRRITLPMARRGILTGIILGSARALGEFGATLMIAGNIPGQTQTLPLAIYDAVQARRYAEANVMVLVMTIIAFLVLWAARRLEPKN